jgi:tRNA A-37 threonylcarbamoyl transferase component Bud32
VPTRPAAWDLFSGGDFYEPLSRYTPNEHDFIQFAIEALGPSWRFTRDGIWFHCTHPTAPLAPQGWKIHVSATTSNAREILGRAIPVLADVGVSFKCAADIRLLSTLNGKTSFRGGSGKFITIYPFDEAQFKELLRRLDAASRDLEGPYILSDRRYSDSKVLFYRYGGFWPRKQVGSDGIERPIIIDPAGEAVFDQRTPHYVKPDWVAEPFPEAEVEDGQESRTLKDGRYYIDGVISFSNSGGVYLATDRHMGRKVVIKEARPLVSRVSEVDDAVAILKKEARLLDKVGDLGISPQLYDVFQDWEHWFIVQEYVEARTLWSLCVSEKAVLLNTRPTTEDYAVFYELFRWVFTGIGEAVAALHERGIVLADLSPHNVLIVEEERRVCLIDYEGAFELGVDTPTNLATPGFVSPERNGRRNAVPVREDDWFALGAMMLSFIFPITVFLQLDPTAAAHAVREICRDARLPDEITGLIEAALSREPERRPAPACIAAALRDCADLAPPPPASGDRAKNPTEAVRQIAAYILGQATPDAEHRLFPCDFRIYRTNPAGLAYGAAGILNALAYVGMDVPDRYVDWTLEAVRRADRVTPGFAHGRSGIAWALLNLDRVEEARAMLELAERDPVKSDAMVLFYGLTGYGLTELAFFLALNDERHLRNARAAADDVLAHARTDQSGNLYWENNGTSIGLAHGATGVALFLLYLHLATGEPRYLEHGRRALAFDMSHGVVMRDGGMEWSYTPADSKIVSPYWAFGSAGIGSVAIRYRHLAGITDFDEEIERIGRSTDRKYTLVPNKQFGLSGLGGYDLDAYAFTGDARYLRAAERIADGIMLYAVERPDGLAFPGSEQSKISCDYATGSAGVMMFLHRLATGKTAEYMLDDHFTGARARTEALVVTS